MKSSLKWLPARLWKGLLLVLVFAAAGLPAVFMDSIYGYVPVLFLALALILSLLCLLDIRRRMAVEAASMDVRCVRGQRVDMELKLMNRSPLFCPKVSACLYCSDLFGQREILKKVSFSMAGREEKKLAFDLEMPHVGVYPCGIDTLEIDDFFGIFKRSVPVSCQFSVCVLPRLRPVEEFYNAEEALVESDQDTRLTMVGGMDYTGVREYAPGDPMKQIHWKLSAHTRGYVTKLQESNRQQDFTVVLDFAAGRIDRREDLMAVNDCLIETALSLIEDISRHDAGYTLLYCDRTRKVARVTSSEYDHLQLLRSFSAITPEPDREFPDAVRILQQAGALRNRNTNFLVVTSRITPELLHDLLLVKRQRRRPELYVVVPASWNRREREDALAPLRQLADAEIPCFLVTA